MASKEYFVDIFESIVAEVRAEYDEANNKEPYFIYGHPVEIAKRLSLKDRDSVEKFAKFPLIVLITDFEESHDADLNIAYTVSPTVLIVDNTEKDYVSNERYDNTFKPVLYPIYNLLIQKILESDQIRSIENLVPHAKTDRLFWGSGNVNGNQSLIFNEWLDAIEIDFSGIEILNTVVCP